MSKHTPGPWHWKGEDYRGNWGWQMLVGPNGEGLIIGDENGEPSSLIRAFLPLDAHYCLTGMESEGKVHANSVHVFSEANARLIAAAPELLEAASRMRRDWAAFGTLSGETIEQVDRAIAKAQAESPENGTAAAHQSMPERGKE